MNSCRENGETHDVCASGQLYYLSASSQSSPFNMCHHFASTIKSQELESRAKLQCNYYSVYRALHGTFVGIIFLHYI